MIWLTNAPGGFLWHGKVLENGRCFCADCLLEGGLLVVGPPHSTDREVVAELTRMGYVGLYRTKPKPWKRK